MASLIIHSKHAAVVRLLLALAVAVSFASLARAQGVSRAYKPSGQALRSTRPSTYGATSTLQNYNFDSSSRSDFGARSSYSGGGGNGALNMRAQATQARQRARGTGRAAGYNRGAGAMGGSYGRSTQLSLLGTVGLRGRGMTSPAMTMMNSGRRRQGRSLATMVWMNSNEYPVPSLRKRMFDRGKRLNAMIRSNNSGGVPSASTAGEAMGNGTEVVHPLLLDATGHRIEDKRLTARDIANYNDDKRYERYLSQAWAHFEAGEYNEAGTQFRLAEGVYTADPSDRSEAHWGAMLTALLMGQQNLADFELTNWFLKPDPVTGRYRDTRCLDVLRSRIDELKMSSRASGRPSVALRSYRTLVESLRDAALRRPGPVQALAAVVLWGDGNESQARSLIGGLAARDERFVPLQRWMSAEDALPPLPQPVVEK